MEARLLAIDLTDGVPERPWPRASGQMLEQSMSPKLVVLVGVVVLVGAAGDGGSHVSCWWCVW